MENKERTMTNEKQTKKNDHDLTKKITELNEAEINLLPKVKCEIRRILNKRTNTFRYEAELYLHPRLEIRSTIKASVFNKLALLNKIDKKQDVISGSVITRFGVGVGLNRYGEESEYVMAQCILRPANNVMYLTFFINDKVDKDILEILINEKLVNVDLIKLSKVEVDNLLELNMKQDD